MSNENLPTGLKRVQALRERNSDPKFINDDLYRLMYRPELYVLAYERIKSSAGNMTKGTDGKTADGTSARTIEDIIKQMRDLSFQFQPARRVYIPKANGKKRPLGVPAFRDKLVQEVMRLILSAIYDSPEGAFFHPNSHGFRPGMGCHTALKQIRREWQGVKWIVEGDIKGCFDNIDHHRLIQILKRKVSDERFIQLVWKALKAGYMEEMALKLTKAGSPQGSIVSPLLANIYLHEFDRFVDRMKQKYEVRTAPKVSKEYKQLGYQIEKLSKLVNELERGSRNRRDVVGQIKKLVKERLQMNPYGDEGGGHVLIHFVRYADDWIIGVNGSKEVAVKIRDEAKAFFGRNLNLELSMEKTHIRHARTEEAYFLGTRIKVGRSKPILSYVNSNGNTRLRKVGASNPVMMAPTQKVVNNLAEKGLCTPFGEPIAKKSWIALDDFAIIEMANSVLRGILNYYSFADNRSTFAYRIMYIIHFSAAKTLCAKHRTSLKQLMSKHGRFVKMNAYDETGKRIAVKQLYKPSNADLNRDPNRFMKGTVLPLDVNAEYGKLTRTKLYDDCAVCGSDDQVQMHHVRHIRKMGEKVEGFVRFLASINRKQIPLCHQCHVKVHKGQYDGISLKELAQPYTATR
jgi:group II intron reverse transcriptase/maturase